MIDLFLEKIPHEITLLGEAIHKNDIDTVRRLSHNMKSSLDIFMLKDLSNYVSIIEKEAILGQFSAETLDRIAILHHEIVEVISVLKELR
jgi:HPt (histidine-containing phosphotransfer) domain-containing protein